MQTERLYTKGEEDRQLRFLSCSLKDSAKNYLSKKNFSVYILRQQHAWRAKQDGSNFQSKLSPTQTTSLFRVAMDQQRM